MTDDLVARLRRMASEYRYRLDAAEARVRELEAHLAETQEQRRQWQEASVRDRAALAEAYERAATWHDKQAASIEEENGAMCRDGMWPDEGRMEQIKFHTSSAAAIRKLAQAK